MTKKAVARQLRLPAGLLALCIALIGFLAVMGFKSLLQHYWLGVFLSAVLIIVFGAFGLSFARMVQAVIELHREGRHVSQ